MKIGHFGCITVNLVKIYKNYHNISIKTICILTIVKITLQFQHRFARILSSRYASLLALKNVSKNFALPFNYTPTKRAKLSILSKIMLF